MIYLSRFWSWFNKPTTIFCLLKASHHWACWVNTSKHWRKVFSLEEGVKKRLWYWVPVLMTEEILKYMRAVPDLLRIDKTAEAWIPVLKADSPWGKRRTKPKICCQWKSKFKSKSSSSTFASWGEKTSRIWELQWGRHHCDCYQEVHLDLVASGQLMNLRGGCLRWCLIGYLAQILSCQVWRSKRGVWWEVWGGNCTAQVRVGCLSRIVNWNCSILDRSCRW